MYDEKVFARVRMCTHELGALKVLTMRRIVVIVPRQVM